MYDSHSNIYWLCNLVHESLFSILKRTEFQEYHLSIWLSDSLKYDLQNLADFCLATKSCCSTRNNRIIQLIGKIGSVDYHVRLLRLHAARSQ